MRELKPFPKLKRGFTLLRILCNLTCHGEAIKTSTLFEDSE